MVAFLNSCFPVVLGCSSTKQGMSVLRKINPTVQRAVADASLPLKLIASRTKPWFGDKEYDTLLTLPIDETFRTAGGRVTEELVVDGEVMAYTIMRGALQVCATFGCFNGNRVIVIILVTFVGSLFSQKAFFLLRKH